jgi:hypothetical protein
MKTTVIDDVILALVAALDTALTYPIFDGPPSKRADRSVPVYLIIGADDAADDEVDSATMSSQWVGLGQVSREEMLDIHCMAVGKAINGSVATARRTAMNAIQDVNTYMPKSLTPETYGGQVSNVDSVKSKNEPGGAIVTIAFTIQVSARLV